MAWIEFPEAGNLAALVKILDCDPWACSYHNGILSISGIGQVALDAAVALYNGDAETYKHEPARALQSGAFAVAVRDRLEDAYPAYRRELLLGLYVEAVQNNATERAEYIQTLLTWVKALAALAMTYDEQLAAASSVAEIVAVDDQATALDAAFANNPGVTIAAALALPDGDN